jgi:hypothetical protein
MTSAPTFEIAGTAWRALAGVGAPGADLGRSIVMGIAPSLYR